MIIRPEAEREIREAIQWYEALKEDLGTAFEEELDRVFEQIERLPEAHRVVYRGVRRALLRRFPFAVYYRIEEKGIVVLAVMHGRRDPDRWKTRA